jgi:hypothetical protein
MVKVGDAVIYIDESSQVRNALVVAAHNQDYINIALVSSDEYMTDQYGRQLSRASSVPRKTDSNAAGRHFIEIQK